MLVQGSVEWLEWRRNGIGSSDAPIVKGVSPWSTPYQLWEIKTKRASEKVANDAMKRGTELEPKALVAYQKLTGVTMVPEVLEHPSIPYVRASLDGINREKGILLEIKAPGAATHAMAKAGKVPEHYQWQLTHQMLASNINLAHYFSFDGENGVIVEVKRNEERERELLELEKSFWSLVQKDLPPPFTDKDYEILTDAEAIKCFAEYKRIKGQIEALEAEQRLCREHLIDFAAGKRVMCEGVMVYTAMRKGSVDYSKIPVLRGLDLEPYRKKPSSVVTVRVKGEPE